MLNTVWEHLGMSGKNWKKIFKVRRRLRPRPRVALTRAPRGAQALQLLEHLIKNGNERVVEDARDHVYHIRTLSDFNYRDEQGVDRGAGGARPAPYRCGVLARIDIVAYHSSRQGPRAHGAAARQQADPHGAREVAPAARAFRRRGFRG